MKTYIYTGPATAMTLQFEKGEPQEVHLWKGKSVSLPDHEYVEVLKAQGLLTQVPTPVLAQAEVAVASAKQVKKGE